MRSMRTIFSRTRSVHRNPYGRETSLEVRSEVRLYKTNSSGLRTTKVFANVKAFLERALYLRPAKRRDCFRLPSLILSHLGDPNSLAIQMDSGLSRRTGGIPWLQ